MKKYSRDIIALTNVGSQIVIDLRKTRALLKEYSSKSERGCYLLGLVGGLKSGYIYIEQELERIDFEKERKRQTYKHHIKHKNLIRYTSY